MTKKETAQLLFLLKEYYPHSFESSSIENRVTAWHLILRDYPYQEAEAAVLAFASTDARGFMPSVGQIVDKLNSLKAGRQLTEMEAWSLVQKACANSLYNAADEYKKLPPTVQRIVGSHNTLREWAMCDQQTFNTVIQSNFMRSYTARAAGEREMMALPQNVKEVLLPMVERMALPE